MFTFVFANNKNDLTLLSVQGGGTIVRHRDLQAAADGGGRLGDDQGAVGPHHFLPAHVGAHRGGIRDSEETEPASRLDRVQTLVRGAEKPGFTSAQPGGNFSHRE